MIFLDGTDFGMQHSSFCSEYGETERCSPLSSGLCGQDQQRLWQKPILVMVQYRLSRFSVNRHLCDVYKDETRTSLAKEDQGKDAEMYFPTVKCADETGKAWRMLYTVMS